MLTGKKTQKGKGDDKTWEWTFSEASKIIEKGYKPNQFKGVLINIIPLCIELNEIKQKDFNIKYCALCPKGTLKHVLKKIDALDQLRNKGSKDLGDEDEDEEINNKKIDKKSNEGEDESINDYLDETKEEIIEDEK
jgi:hypothetical protein